jgi:tetratricopeptide (TPR) repeat protein
MSAPLSARAVELLLNEGWDAFRDGRYARARSAAERALQAAEQLDDPALLVRVLVIRAAAARMDGNPAAALASYTRILALAEDPATGHRLGGRSEQWAVASAYVDWVEAAMFVTNIPLRDLFDVLDAAERWLAATGHSDWRAGLLSARASLHKRLGEIDAAITAAEEALVSYRTTAPGPTLGAHRWTLADILREAGRHLDAEPYYQAILNDPVSTDNSRKVAYQGLALCALTTGDNVAAHRYATESVAVAEVMGDDALCPALGTLVESCLAIGENGAAWAAANRHLACANRIEGHYRLYYAVRDMVDVALDRHDWHTARQFLSELETHATAMDKMTGRTIFVQETKRRGERLAEPEPRSKAG